MKTRILSLSTMFLTLTLAGACGGDDDGGTIDGGGDGQEPDAAGGADASAAGDYQSLVTTDWTLPAPTSSTPDQYFCARLTVQEDMIVSGFRTISPNGTHHTVLSAGDPNGPDNPGEPCEVQNMHQTILYASGVGTDDFVFPEGVGVRVQAGQQLHLNVHTFNATDFELSGTSGVAAKLVPAVETEAEFTIVGPIGFSIPGDGKPFQVSGSCPVSQDITVLNWWPHMHKLGSHQTIEVNGEVVHDEPFSFTEQVNYPTSRQLAAGDNVRVTCTFVNDTGAAVPFGDSSNQEMCFAGSYRYPKAELGDEPGFCIAQPE